MTYPQGNIEYSIELEQIALKMNNGLTYDQAKAEWDFENRELEMFD